MKNNVNLYKNYKYFFDGISKDFFDWIVGIQEDEPLQTEAKNVYLIVDFSQNDIALSYSADEKKLLIFDYGAYFPLEAQYLDSLLLKKLGYELFCKKSISKQSVFDMLKSICFSASKEIDFLKNRHIFFGKRFSKVKK